MKSSCRRRRASPGVSRVSPTRLPARVLGQRDVDEDTRAAVLLQFDCAVELLRDQSADDLQSESRAFPAEVHREAEAVVDDLGPQEAVLAIKLNGDRAARIRCERMLGGVLNELGQDQ